MGIPLRRRLCRKEVQQPETAVFGATSKCLTYLWPAKYLKNNEKKYPSLRIPLLAAKCYMFGHGPYLANVPLGIFSLHHEDS
jgi:hypothetical protein